MVDSSMFTLLDGDKREFEPGAAMEIMTIMGDNFLFLENINPGMVRSGTFVFEVPAEVATYTLKIHPGMVFKTGKPVLVKLK
ncbi:Telomeric repeat-binding factor 2 [compost metagenome]